MDADVALLLFDAGLVRSRWRERVGTREEDTLDGDCNATTVPFYLSLRSPVHLLRLLHPVVSVRLQLVLGAEEPN
jgi:hypothetical protein